MFKTIRKIEIFVIVAAIALVGIIYAFKQKPAQLVYNNQVPANSTSVNPESAINSQSAQQVPTTVITYQGVAGANALDLLKAGHRVVATHYSFGDLVTGIDGITPDSKHFWAMYVNDQFSQVGASAYMTKSTDTIKWEIDAVVDTTK